MFFELKERGWVSVVGINISERNVIEDVFKNFVQTTSSSAVHVCLDLQLYPGQSSQFYFPDI